MFAYCGNNPVNKVDPSGYFWDFIEEALNEIGKAIGILKPAYATCGGATLIDGPLPFGDIAAVIGTGILTIGAIGYGTYKAITNTNDDSKPEEGEKDVTYSNPRKNRIIFPVNPYEFKQLGLEMIPLSGTNNGEFLIWKNKITNQVIFRWDENITKPNGPHYHILSLPSIHFYAGERVPEPYASIYFGGGINVD